MKKDDLVFIEHILDSINALEKFSKGLSKEKLAINRLKQSAIVREIEIIGEASKNISKKIKEKYPKIEWKDIINTRNKMIHQCFGVDLDIVWNIINADIPILKKQIFNVKKELQMQSQS